MTDDRLRLIFTCCHPALRAEHHVALTLRLLGGLSVDEVARSFLVSEPAMAKRLVRAKYRAAHVQCRVPAVVVVSMLSEGKPEDPQRACVQHAVRVQPATVSSRGLRDGVVAGDDHHTR